MHNFLARFSPSGIWKALETCQSFFDWSLIALTNLGWECPKELTAIPWIKSKYFLPSIGGYVELTYNIDSFGKININTSLSEISSKLPMLPKFGTNLIINKQFEKVRWYGRGPHENYQDRKTSSLIGIYECKVSDLYIHI